VSDLQRLPPEAGKSLRERLLETPYDAYLYAYPHKTAYGALAPARPLEEVWRNEDKSALFLYVHVPFCEMRCGFCNLFTTPVPKPEVVSRYLEVLDRSSARVASELGAVRYARFAMGGGTPTLLEPDALVRVLDLVEGTMGAHLSEIPASVETSPETCTRAKATLLVERGVDRVSIGVQSFVEEESAAVKRPQSNPVVFAALDALRAAGVPELNVDLMYGLPGQTLATWESSLRTALRWSPEELYLYPLYVRPVTTLGRRARDWDDERLAMYRHAVSLLVAEGYEQTSMRMFRRRGAWRGGDERPRSGPVYCVQLEGLVGLGPGARSYTRALHYSTEWAVSARGVREILDAWLGAPDEGPRAQWGFELDGEEQRRRWVATSLFVDGGLDLGLYGRRFGSSVWDDLPALRELSSTGCAELRAGSSTTDAGVLVLTALGLERSDTIGPWLYSDAVRAKMRAYEVR
jgi:oxygen-independent coproporphyrinogen III oxidase